MKPIKPSNHFSSSDLIDGKVIRHARDQGIPLLKISPSTLVTPLARDLASDYGIVLEIICVSKNTEFKNNVVALGSDHGGYVLKEELKKSLQDWKYEILDVGPHSNRSVDYPDYAYKVALAVKQQKAWRGIMIDGVGIGSCMMANKLTRIRAANCHNLFEIKNSRNHNNANVLCIGGQTLGVALAKEMVRIWLLETFEGGRHAKRVDKINDLDQGNPPIV